MASYILVSIGSGDGLLPDVTKLSEVLQHFSEGNFTENDQDTYLWYEFENY